MVQLVLHLEALDLGAGPGALPLATAIRKWQLLEGPPVIPKDQEVGQEVQEGDQEAVEKDQEATEEDQELLPGGHEVGEDCPGAQVGGQGARCGDQGARHGDQEALDQGAGLALSKGGHGGGAQVEEGLQPTHHTGDLAHHPHQGHEALRLRSWVIAGVADGRGHPATEDQGDGGRPLLHPGLNLCCPLKSGRREKKRKAGFWRGFAMTRVRSCLPTISERSWRVRSV